MSSATWVRIMNVALLNAAQLEAARLQRQGQWLRGFFARLPAPPRPTPAQLKERREEESRP